MSTPLVDIWKGSFGDDYTERCLPDDDRLHRATIQWANLLGRIASDPPKSILEIGANVGLNLMALQRITSAQLWALEPNVRARSALGEILAPEQIIDGTAENIPLADGVADLVFTSGVLIHIHPDNLLRACSEIVRCARKYVVCIEYFSHEPEVKQFRGQEAILFKRDFGSFYLDCFPDLKIVDCGFNWRRTTGASNTTWWILRR
jgi:pseudaminic acid biosynthesis-associated methylase